MPKVTVYDMTGKSVGEMNLSDAVFGIEPNTAVMHAAVVNYLANQRQGTQSTLTRSEVRGEPATPDRAPSGLPSGPTAASPWARSPVITATRSTARSSAWPSSRPSLPR